VLFGLQQLICLSFWTSIGTIYTSWLITSIIGVCIARFS
jgi:phosphate/sulfate permease